MLLIDLTKQINALRSYAEQQPHTEQQQLLKLLQPLCFALGVAELKKELAELKALRGIIPHHKTDTHAKDRKQGRSR